MTMPKVSPTESPLNNLNDGLHPSNIDLTKIKLAETHYLSQIKQPSFLQYILINSLIITSFYKFIFRGANKSVSILTSRKNNKTIAFVF